MQGGRIWRIIADALPPGPVGTCVAPCSCSHRQSNQRQALVPESPIMLPPAHGSTGHEKNCGLCGGDLSRFGHPRDSGGGSGEAMVRAFPGPHSDSRKIRPAHSRALLASRTPCDRRECKCPSPPRAIRWPRALQNQKSEHHEQSNVTSHSGNGIRSTSHQRWRVRNKRNRPSL
jgi:hypothetical protein